MTTNISIYVIAEESLRYWKKRGKKNGARNLQIWDLFISLIDGRVLLCQLLLATRFQGICTFSYTQGARNSIESQPKYYSIRRLLASSRSSNKLLIPLKKLARNQSLHESADISSNFSVSNSISRHASFVFFSSTASISIPNETSALLLEFHREFRWKTIHESLISLPFPRLQLDDVQEDLKR